MPDERKVHVQDEEGGDMAVVEFITQCRIHPIYGLQCRTHKLSPEKPRAIKNPEEEEGIPETEEREVENEEENEEEEEGESSESPSHSSEDAIRCLHQSVMLDP